MSELFKKCRHPVFCSYWHGIDVGSHEKRVTFLAHPIAYY